MMSGMLCHNFVHVCWPEAYVYGARLQPWLEVMMITSSDVMRMMYGHVFCKRNEGCSSSTCQHVILAR